MRLLLLLLLMLPCAALADDDHPGHGHGHHDGGGTLTGGDVSNTLTGGDASVGDIVGGSIDSKTLALGRSSYGVQIRDCRESTAFDIVVYGRQTVRLNPWCAAGWYDQYGLHKMAALVRCDLPEVKTHFPNDPKACVVANTLPKVVPDKPDYGALLAPLLDEITALYATQVELLERLDSLEARKPPRARVVTVQAAPDPYAAQARADIMDIFK